MNHTISSFCNPENEKTSDLCNIFSKNSHICNEGVLRKEKTMRRMNQRNSHPYENMSQEEKDQRNLQLMDQQIQQSRGIRKIFFLVLRKMQKDNIEADRRKHDHKWHIRFR